MLLAGLLQACWACVTASAASAGECTIIGTAPMVVTCSEPNIDTLNGTMSPFLDNDGNIIVTVDPTSQVIGDGLVVETTGLPHTIDIINNGLIAANIDEQTSGALEIAGNGDAVRYSGNGVVQNINSDGNGIYATNEAAGSIRLDIGGGVVAGQAGYAVAAIADQGAVTISTGSGLLVGGVGLAGMTAGGVVIENHATIQARDAGIVANACGCAADGMIRIESYGDITVSDPSGYGIVAADASTMAINVRAGTVSANVGVAVSTSLGTAADIFVGEGGAITATNIGIEGRLAQSNITIAGAVSGLGTAAIYLGSDNDTVTLHGTAQVTGTVYAGIGPDFNTLILGGSVAGLFDLDKLDPGMGQFVGFDAVRKTGVSTWTVDDTGGFYSGTIQVDQGKLRVDTAIAGLTADIGVAGILGGTGTLGSFIANGTVAPGNSIGVLTTADATFNPGSTFAVEIDPAQSDQLKATNSATINGGTVSVTAAFGVYAPGQQYDILITDPVGSIIYAPGFSGVTINSGLLDPTLIQDNDKVILSITPVAIASRGLTPNQKETGRALDVLGTGGPHYAALFALSAAELPGALDMLSGEVHATGRSVLLDQSGPLREAVLDRIDAAFEAVPATGALPYAGLSDTDPEVERNLWASAYGMAGVIAADGNAAETRHLLGGLAAGADGFIGPWRVGLMAGYGHGGITTRAATADIDTASVGLYAGTEMDDTRLSFGALYSGHALATRRSVTLPGVNETLVANYGAGTAQAFAKLSHSVDFGPYELEPFAQLGYVNLSTASVAETGGISALSAPASSMNALSTTIGLGGETDMVLEGGILATVKGSAGWRQTFADQPLSSNTFAGTGPFTIAGASASGGALVLSAGMNLDFSAAARLNLTYDGQLAQAGHNHAFKASLSGQF